MSVFSSFFNILCRVADMYKERKKKISKDIYFYEDIVYGPNPKINVLDIYIPKNVSGYIPVFLSIHGGGFVYGDRSVSHPYCEYVCQRGFAVINFSYHLAPKYHFPKPIEDLNYVVKFILENKDRYKFDTSNIFFQGESAGAHIAMVYANICTNKEYSKQFDFMVPEGFCPKAVCLNCGVVNAKLALEGHDFISWFMKHLLCDYYGKKNLDNNDIKILDPMENITKEFPFAIITTGKGDILNKQVKSLDSKLKNMEKKYHFREYGKTKVNSGHVFHLNIKNKYAKLCNRSKIKVRLDFFSFCENDKIHYMEDI